MENVRHLNPRDTAGDGGFERVPPQDLEAEQSVLGGMLLSKDAIADVTEVLDGTDFYRPAHETIYATILGLHAAGDPADIVTVTNALRQDGQLDRVGGAPYIHRLPDQVPTAANSAYYAEIVHNKARLRRLVEAASRIVNWGYAADNDVDDIMAAARKEFDGAATTAGHGPGHLTEAVLEWDQFFTTDFGSIQLLPGRLMASGQQIALVGDGKSGKSLVSLEWAWRMASGLPFLGDAPQAPIRVLYVDAENGHQQIQERLFSFGAGPGRMGALTYVSFPRMRPLDTAGGGADLMALAHHYDAQVVFLDTISRFVAGVENEADTWLALYRNTLLPLKRAGIASIRLDHFGKDKERGARGNSAKTQDVDHVWELAAQGGGILSLRRTHTRTGIGPDAYTVRRDARRDGDTWVPGCTRHVLVVHEHIEQNIEGTVEWLVLQLDRAGVPNDAGNRVVKGKLADLRIPAGSTKIQQVVTIRRNRDKTGSAECSPERSPDLFPETFPGNVPGNISGSEETAGQTFPGNTGGTPGTPHVPHAPHSEGGGQGGTPPGAGPDAPLCTVCGTPLHGYRADRGYDTCLSCDPTTGSHPNTPGAA